jgi:ADP-ribose pyrophosphatase
MPKILKEHEAYKGWVRVIRRTIQHPNGGIQHYDIVNPDTHTVCAVAFDQSDRIILVEMYRFGQNRRLQELPAGSMEPGETFVEAMHRELLEETGYEGDLEEIGTYPIAAEHGVTRHVFIARNCKRVASPRFDQSEIDEGARVMLVSLNEFKTLVRCGKMTETASAFMALDHLRLL